MTDRSNAFTMREPISPANWRELDGWRGEPAAFLENIIARMNGEFASEGFDAYWLIQDFHRIAKVEPYIMLGVRPADTNKTILIAFGFPYSLARTWPPHFAEHYAQQVCAHYNLFEADIMMPPSSPCANALKTFCEENGIQPSLWTVPPDHFAHDRKKRDIFDELEDDQYVSSRPDHASMATTDPFEEMEQEDPLS